MLVLVRRVGQSLYIGHDITVSVVDIGGGAVRLAIDAPPDVIVLRDELVEKPKSDEKRD